MANQFRKIIGCNIRLQPDYPQTAKLVIPSEALGVSGCIRRPRVPRRAWGEVRGRGGMSASDPSNREKLPRAQAIPRDLRRAIDYMREDEGRRLSIVYLVAHCGVSERTLHKHFRLFMEVSPLEYWRRHRLAAAREVFLKATSDTSVTEMATRFGFSHFGRFSQQYRRCFDETPSETLQRNRIAQGKRTAPAGGDGANASGAVGVATRLWRERPSVTVIPFRVPAEWQWFGESLAEGIGAALCRMHSLSVAVSRPRASIPAPGTRRLAREFGTRYLMSGSVTQSGGRMRLIVRLVDAATGFHVWGDTYDGSTGDPFELQDRVTDGIVRTIGASIRGAEIESARRIPPRDLNAYGLMMQAYPFVFASFPRAARRALDFLERAIEFDPDYAPATALAAWCHAQLVMHNGTASPKQERERALLLSERAGILDPDDPLVLTARSAVHTMATHFDHAGHLVTRALALDPNFVWAWDRSGWLKAYLGEPEAAINHFNRATRLNSGPPTAVRLIGIGCAHFDAGRYEQAAVCKQKALQEHPGMAWINRTLSISFARLGERKAALDSLYALQRYSAELTITQVTAAIPFRSDFLRRVAEGLDDLGLAA